MNKIMNSHNRLIKKGVRKLSIERLKQTIKCIQKCEQKYSYDYYLQFLKTTLTTFKEQQAQITELKGKVKKLEQKDFPKGEIK